MRLDRAVNFTWSTPEALPSVARELSNVRQDQWLPVTGWLDSTVRCGDRCCRGLEASCKIRPVFRGSICLVIVLLSLLASASPRVERELSKGWRFIKQDVPGAQAPALDDHEWQSVTVPHTWNVDDGADGGTYYRGPGWYRLRLRIGTDLAGYELFLRFGAASLVADVYVNGRPAGRHEGGFGAFCFDVTKLLNPGDNLVAVRVDNARNLNVTPLSGDFTIYGGLYREVKLIALDPVHISPLDDAGPGVYLTPKVTDTEARVAIAAKVRNDRRLAESIEVRTRILDRKGNQVGEDSKSLQIPPESSSDVSESILVAKPRLWNGVLDPYLYRAEVVVVDSGRVVDEVDQQVGFRYFTVDPEGGLLLNGKPYDMHGVNLHQGRPSVGWAVTRSLQDEDYAMVHELGCTGVRMPHYQHAEHEYELCDRYGILVWAELALVNQVTDSPEFYANAKQQLRELIKQNYNRPSILFWSMYNEPNVDRRRGDNEWRLVKELVALAHEEDPTRLTTGAASMSAKEPLDWYMDLASFNRYWGWYGGTPEQWEASLQALRKEAGGRSFGISEFGAGASIHQHETNPKHPATTGRWHPEEWQAEVHEKVWPVLENKPWMWCKLLWVMFDFSSDGRSEGDHLGINDKGLVTGDRKTRKDAFFYYKAYWSETPFAAIADRRYDPHPGGQVTVKVYSNCDSVELWLNGKTMGSKRGADHIFTWSLNLPAGTADLEAFGSKGGQDRVIWTVAK